MSISQKFQLYEHPAQMEPLLPSEHRMGPLLEPAHDLIRKAACLTYEQEVVKQGVRTEALRPLHYLFASQAALERADFKAMLGLGDRLASAQVTALLKRRLIETDSPYGQRRLGVPLHALRFYFPRLRPEAEGQG